MGWTSGFPEIMETASAYASEMTCSGHFFSHKIVESLRLTVN